jgi:hypothetical protein
MPGRFVGWRDGVNLVFQEHEKRLLSPVYESFIQPWPLLDAAIFDRWYKARCASFPYFR